MSALDVNEAELASSEAADDGSYDVMPVPPETVWIAVDTGDKKDGASQKLLSTIPDSCP
jgi:hypothetical protein